LKRIAQEVVGVVANANYNSVRQTAPPTIYYSFEQSPSDFDLSFITRSGTTASAVAFERLNNTTGPETSYGITVDDPTLASWLKIVGYPTSPSDLGRSFQIETP